MASDHKTQAQELAEQLEYISAMAHHAATLTVHNTSTLLQMSRLLDQMDRCHTNIYEGKAGEQQRQAIRDDIRNLISNTIQMVKDFEEVTGEEVPVPDTDRFKGIEI